MPQEINVVTLWWLRETIQQIRLQRRLLTIQTSNVSSHSHCPGSILEPCFHSLGEGSTRKVRHLPNPGREMATPRWQRNTF
jgi:hypothetical protein